MYCILYTKGGLIIRADFLMLFSLLSGSFSGKEA